MENNYKFTQNGKNITVTIPLQGNNKTSIVAELVNGTLYAGPKGKRPLIRGKLSHDVESVVSKEFEDDVLTINLKSVGGQIWSSLFKTIEDGPTSRFISHLVADKTLEDDGLVLPLKEGEIVGILANENDEFYRVEVQAGGGEVGLVRKNSLRDPTEDEKKKIRPDADFGKLLLPGQKATLTMLIAKARKVDAADLNGKSDPYIKIVVDGKEIKKTSIKKRTLNPVWNETFAVEIDGETFKKIDLELFDWDKFSKDDSLGTVTLTPQILADCPSQRWHKIRPLGSGEVYLDLKLQIHK